MELNPHEAIARAEDKMKPQFGLEVRALAHALVLRYRAVLDDEKSIEEARTWYVRASDAYDSFKLRGDKVSSYQGVLQHTYLYCEERYEQIMKEL